MERNRDTISPTWLARNPKGRVLALSPVIGSSGGETGLLTEVPAILTWLARQRPNLDLIPANAAREARALEWINWLSGWVHAVAFAQQWRPERFSDDVAAHAGITAKGNANLIEAFGAIERTLSDGRQWAVPDTYSVVDAYLIVFYRWGGLVGIDMTAFAAWSALTVRTMERTAVQVAFKKDGLTSDIPRTS